MPDLLTPAAVRTPARRDVANAQRRSVRRARRVAALAACTGLLALAVLASLAVGSNRIPVDDVVRLLVSPDGSAEAGVLHEQRVPRTVVAAIVGAALALAGCLMQSVTRNPLADPGILGVNAGASLAVVTAVALTGIISLQMTVSVALLGAAAATVTVYALAGTGRPSSSPARLALAGVAVSAALQAITQTVILADQVAFNEFRFWVSGSLQARGWPVLEAVAPLLAIGLLLALALSGPLNTLALGDDTARALGANPGRTRALSVVAVALLCGAATAAVGPIGFVGLAVPLIARWWLGHDLRWVLGACLLLGPAWLLLADTLARVLVPEEVPAGVIAALVGAPVFIAVVSRRKVPAS